MLPKELMKAANAPDAAVATDQLNELYAHHFFATLASQGFAPSTKQACAAALQQAVLLDEIELPVDKTAAADPYVASFERLQNHMKIAGAGQQEGRTQLALAAFTDPTIYRAALAASGLS